MNEVSEPSLLRTGTPSLDDILLGGLPKGHIYLVEGDPGTGKTTLGVQFILEGKRAGQRCLYVTLSESKTELELSAQSHKWSLDGVPIAEFVPEEATLNDEDHVRTVRVNKGNPGDRAGIVGQQRHHRKALRIHSPSLFDKAGEQRDGVLDLHSAGVWSGVQNACE